MFKRFQKIVVAAAFALALAHPTGIVKHIPLLNSIYSGYGEQAPAAPTNVHINAPNPSSGDDGPCGSAGCIYVDNSCSTAGNGTVDSCGGATGRMTNLQTAITAAVAGNTIVVHAGSGDYVTTNGMGYTGPAGFTFANSGTAGNVITLRNATGERPVLRNCAASETDADSACNRPTLNANNKQYIRITSDSCPTAGPATLGLHVVGAVLFYDDGGASESLMAHGSEMSCTEVTRGYSCGVSCNPGSGGFGDGNWSGLWVQGQFGFTDHHNYIHDITTNGMTGAGIQSSMTCVKFYETSNSSFFRSTCKDVYPPDQDQAGGYDCKADCVNNQLYELDIRNVSICFRVENQETGDGPYTANGAQGTVFHNNVCVSATPSVRGAIRLESGKITGVTAYNNTFVGFFEVLEEVHQPALICQGVVFYNNALYGTTDNHFHFGDSSGTECTLQQSDYNYFGTAASAPRFRYVGASYTALSNFVAGTGFDTHSTEIAEASFLFTNVGSGIYTLQAGSPLQSAGHVGGVSGGAAIDVGAYTDSITCVGHACS